MSVHMVYVYYEWVVFTRPYMRCCICSANYCKFHWISLLVWLVDMIALFLVMWPLSWYQFCVSLPLEVRTVGLVLFLQVLTLLSVLHCLPPASHVEPVFSDKVFSAAVHCNNRELHNTEKKVLFCHLCRPCPPAKRTNSLTPSFFNQFSDFLQHSDSLPGKTLLMGDFNFHFENVENNNSRKLHDIIDLFNPVRFWTYSQPRPSARLSVFQAQW